MPVFFAPSSDKLQPLPFPGEAQKDDDRRPSESQRDLAWADEGTEGGAFHSQLSAEERKARKNPRAKSEPQEQGRFSKNHGSSPKLESSVRRTESFLHNGRAAARDETDGRVLPRIRKISSHHLQSKTNLDAFIDLTQGSGTENVQNYRLDAERIRLEESRRARLEQTKDGKFVQLGTSAQHDASKRARPQEKIVSWRSSPASQETRSSSNSIHNALEELKRNNSLPGVSSGPVTITSHVTRDRDTSAAIAQRLATRRGAYARASRSKFSFKDISLPYLPSSALRPETVPKRRIVRTKEENDDDDDEEEAESEGISPHERYRRRMARKLSGPAKQIYLPEFITVSNLATVLKLRVEDFATRLRGLGFEATNNDLILDRETASLIAAEFNFEPMLNTGASNDLFARPPPTDAPLLPSRPPVVTIMGHVDHGKTTLLDWLRNSSVAASEHGGITQHIGAFSVSISGGRLITFLDTPGHAAFLSMRERGANVTDIVILVVAADDSVKPQTIEAIKHAQAARVPMIVAVSKIDKPEADVERVKHDLARHSVEIEDFGGDTQVVCISGKTGQGMVELEDAVIALADILDIRAETDGQAEGRVVESTTKKGGRIATVLVQRGTITRGDVLVAGSTWAKVRSLRNEAGAQVTAAGPGMPVEIDGWKDLPAAGDEVLQAPDEKTAKSVVEVRIEQQKSYQMAMDMVAINETRRLDQEKRELEILKARQARAAAAAAAAARAEGRTIIPPPEPPKAPPPAPKPLQPSIKEVFFIIKADVSGSVEAVHNSVSPLGNSEVCAHILRSGVGPVNEFDIEHAATAKGHIICFNVTVEPKMARMAEAAGLKILDHRIIYNLVDDVKAMLSEQLKPNIIHTVRGEAEVTRIFEITAKNKVTVPIAGCKVRNGVLSRKHKVRVLRNRKVIFDGAISSLRHASKDVTEMHKDSECGMAFDDWSNFSVGDQVRAYEEIIEKRSL
ncbi:hypothetical protein MMC07_000628 [Pseudocyphellaria aurata]|nr:hypothetical protein [Pseudocyphellaria aurata]